VKEPGTGVPWAPRPPPGGGGGAGPRSWLMVKMWFVLLSNVIVRAPFIVSRFCATSKLVGLFSLTTVKVPLPCVLKASMVEGLNAAPSDPPASSVVGGVVRVHLGRGDPEQVGHLVDHHRQDHRGQLRRTLRAVLDRPPEQHDPRP